MCGDTGGEKESERRRTVLVVRKTERRNIGGGKEVGSGIIRGGEEVGSGNIGGGGEAEIAGAVPGGQWPCGSPSHAPGGAWLTQVRRTVAGWVGRKGGPTA